MEARREADLRVPVRTWFEERGFRVFDEFPVLGRRADLAAFRGLTTAAAELKLRNWRQALAQAKSYQLAVDFSFVAMPIAGALRAYPYREDFEREGVGLVAVRATGEVTVPIPPQRSERKMSSIAWEFTRSQRLPGFAFDLSTTTEVRGTVGPWRATRKGTGSPHTLHGTRSNNRVECEGPGRRRSRGVRKRFARPRS